MQEIVELRYALDTFYVLVCGFLVMWMSAGFSMLEAGLVRGKNTVEILTKNVALFAIACVAYQLAGWALMYGGAESPWLPNPGASMLGLVDHTPDAVRAGEGAPRYARAADFFFQVLFVSTAASIVSGAVAERMKLWAFLGFSAFMAGFIYPVQGYWHWGGGFLAQAGFVDFAGSGVVHLCGASAAFAAVTLLGPRLSKYGKTGRIHPLPGANLPLAALGALILWFGWFGFNGGSALHVAGIEAANLVARAVLNTNMAAAGGLIAALAVSRAVFGKADLTMALNGALAGLVAITADPVSPAPGLATLIGAAAGALVVGAIVRLDRWRIDDPVGAISVHGVSGVFGLLAVCLSNPQATLTSQLLGIGVIAGWTLACSFVALTALRRAVGIRVSVEDEFEGLDAVECGLEAYPEFIGPGR